MKRKAGRSAQHERGNKNYDNVTKALPKPDIVVGTGCGFTVCS